MICKALRFWGVLLFRSKSRAGLARYTQFGVSDASVSAGRAEPIDECDADNVTTIFF